ncbi:MAG TPA: TonB-dependent receptor [Novosphingobium sp.]|nr:TonB-dependent receptor [Novosphingobium sp.]HMP56346.1 TonB-dependent receptor [Novosphingobium sp.]
MKRIRSGLLSFCALSVFAASNASAQDMPAEDERLSGMSEIVVTAQRRAERVQDIPVAISAFGGEQIERAGIASLENIAPRVPSFYFGSFGAARPQLYIRGIGTRSFDPGSESSVGVFADDVYLGRSSGSFGAMKDIERVEVLRGPQGTLYGRNTIGGAINVISRAPTDELTGSIEGGISNFGGYNLFGALGGPILEDKVMFRLAAWREERDGYVTNTVTGNRFQGIDNTGARARLTLAPTTNLKIDLTAEFMNDGNKAGFGGFSQGTFGDARGVFFRGSGTPVTTTDLRRGALSFDPFLDRKVRAYIGRIEYDAGAATITSISALRKLNIRDGRDLEGSSLDILDQSSAEKSKQFTQELRIASTPGGALSANGLIDWIVGGFYYHDTSDRVDSFRVGINSAVRAAAGTPATDVALSDYRIESYALFGQATIHLTDALDLTLGGRYSHDRKRAIQAGTTTDTAPIIAAPFTTTNRATYSSFDPRIVLAYKVSRDANVYASFSTGFKSGGFQYVPFSKGQADVLFKPEDIKAYEVGFKTEWLDRALRVNGAAFYYDYKNLQISRIILPAGSTAPVSLISNAASSTIKGVDLEIAIQPARSFEVNIAYGYLDARYDKYVFNATTDFSNTRMVRAPEHSLNVGAEWRRPFWGDGEISLRADYALTGDFFHEPGEGNLAFGTGIPLTAEDGYGLLDLRLTLTKNNWRVTAYANNVGNTRYRRTINALGNTVVGFAGVPRIYGAKIGYSF